MPKYDIDKIEELLTKGTQGDWDVVGYTTVVNHAAHQRIADVAGHSAEERAANAQLIPALHNAAPAMIADLRRLREVEKAARGMLAGCICVSWGTPCTYCGPLRKALEVEG